MKFTLCSLVVSVLTFSNVASAGVNGKYKVSGSETEDGKTYSITGNLKVSSYKSATLTYNAGDGTSDSFTFKFNKRLNEVSTPQTVTAYNSEGTGTLNFTFKRGKNFVKFTYRSRDGYVRGSVSGSK